MVELLAPAGEIDSGFAAFQYGADAVYLGLSKFSARAEAVNFTPEQLQTLTGYAHAHKKRVLAAVNTLVFDDEFASLADTLYTAQEAGVDGVIVQDLGVAKLIKNAFPQLRLHASTQLAAHNKDGVLALKDLGFKRVVLARELTLEEIADISKNAGIETEVFIHGALCYSYSGLCLFSAIYTGRSANRGKCVYPCRENVCFDGEKGFAFSMRDLAQVENVRRLADAGVTALKIEGRKKTPLYTAAVTDLYRHILDGADKKTVAAKKAAVSTIFSRATTELYLNDRKNDTVADVNIVGHRGLKIGAVEKVFSKGGARFVRFTPTTGFARYDGIQIDLENAPKPYGFSAETLLCAEKNVFEVAANQNAAVSLPSDAPFIAAGAPVYLASSGAVKKAYPFTRPDTDTFKAKEKISVTVALEKSGITAFANEASVTVTEQLPPAKSPENVAAGVRKAFEKTGDTALCLAELTVINPDALFAPPAVLNDARRQLYAQLDAALVQQKQEKRTAAVAAATRASALVRSVKTVEKRRYLIKTDDAENLKNFTPADFEKVDEIIYEITPQTTVLPDVPREKLRLALPVICRGWETAAMQKKIAELTAGGFSKWEIGNVWGMRALNASSNDVTADWTLYAANVTACRALFEAGLSRVTVSPETPAPESMFDLFPDKTVAMIYQDIPLFISETCPKKTLHGQCVGCGGNFNQPLASRYGKFEAVSRACRFRLLNERPHIKKSEAVKANARLLRLDFMYRVPNPAGVLKTFCALSTD